MPSSGITFRHQQNPSLNAIEGGEANLKNFYGYKETFNKDATWVDVPKELKFIYTNNPYEDSEDVIDAGEANRPEGQGATLEAVLPQQHDGANSANEQLVRVGYPEYATQGLEALSVVASQNQYNYASSPPAMTQDEQLTLQRALQQASGELEVSHPASNQRLGYISNPASSKTVDSEPSNIDPDLSSVTLNTDSLASSSKADGPFQTET